MSDAQTLQPGGHGLGLVANIMAPKKEAVKMHHIIFQL